MLKKRFFKTKDEVEVTFEFSHVPAETVALAGEFNNWEPQAMKQLKSGEFKTRVRLPLDGEFEFRYLIDGETWENDDAADAYRKNEHGTDNSVVFTAKA